MGIINSRRFDLGAESQNEAVISTESLQRQVDQLERDLAVAGESDPGQRAKIGQMLASLFVELEQPGKAWGYGRPSFDYYVSTNDWENAVQACDTLFSSGHGDALVALGHGLWLSITFPVNPLTTVTQLQYVIDETPDDADGAAVAAAVAGYVVGIRSHGNTNDDATLAAGQMMNDVARRHGNVSSQQEFNAWSDRLELKEPEKFLVRMRNIIDVLVQDQWWFDREQLQALIPE